jgi:hypothetical protein
MIVSCLEFGNMFTIRDNRWNGRRWHVPGTFRKTDSDITAGWNRLLRAGFKMVGAALLLWLASVSLARIGWNGGSDPVAQILLLTSTILLWPFATLGVLMVVCGLLIRAIGGARSLSR